MSIRKSVMTLTAIILATAAMQAGAVAKDFSVNYKKSELTTMSGAQAVFSRVETAAIDLCRFEAKESFATKSNLRLDRCIRRTKKEFVQMIGGEKLQRVYAAKLISPKDRKGNVRILARK